MVLSSLISFRLTRAIFSQFQEEVPGLNVEGKALSNNAAGLIICLVSHAFAEWTGSMRSGCGDSELNSTGLQLGFRIGEMAFGTFSDSSTEIIVISLFKSISSSSARIAKDDLSLLIASSFADIEIIG